MDPIEPTASEPPGTIPPPAEPSPPLLQPNHESSSAPPPQPTPLPAATPPSTPSTTHEIQTQTPATQPETQQQPHSQTQPRPQFQPQPLTQPPQRHLMPPPSHTRTITPRPTGSFSHFHQKAPGSSPTSSAVVMPPPSQTTSTTAMQRGGLAIGVPAIAHPRSGPVPFSSFGPTPSFGQSFGAGVAEKTSSTSNPQTRPPFQGIQNIGMIGSLNTTTHKRLASVSTQLHQRPSQSTVRSITPGISPSPNVQKLANQAPARISSLASPTTGPPQSTQPIHQPWMSSQARPMPASSLSSASYRPSVRPQNLQQRPTIQQQQYYQIPQKQLQQQQKQHTPHSHQTLGTQNQQQQQQLAKNHTSMHQQQPSPRAASQKPQVPITAQLGTFQPGMSSPVVNSEDADSGSRILGKRSIRELISQVDPYEKLDPEVEDILAEIADDFIESNSIFSLRRVVDYKSNRFVGKITTVACSLAKHRKSNTLEVKDILLPLERNWNITLPGFGGDDIKGYKKPSVADVVHKERLAVIKKSMAGTSEAGNVKTSTPGQSNTNVKSHVTKAPIIGSPKLL